MRPPLPALDELILHDGLETPPVHRREHHQTLT